MIKQESLDRARAEYYADLAAEAALKSQQTPIQKALHFAQPFFTTGLPLVAIIFTIFAVHKFRQLQFNLLGNPDDKSTISRRDFNLLKGNDLLIKFLLGITCFVLGLFPTINAAAAENDGETLLSIIWSVFILSQFFLIPYLIFKNKKLSKKIFESGLPAKQP